jgi:hypothetical protein
MMSEKPGCQSDQGSCPGGLGDPEVVRCILAIRVGLAGPRRLSVYPGERTFLEWAGMSRRCPTAVVARIPSWTWRSQKRAPPILRECGPSK